MEPTNDTTTINATNSNQKKKKLILLGVILVILVIIPVIFFLYTSRVKQTTPPIQTLEGLDKKYSNISKQDTNEYYTFLLSGKLTHFETKNDFVTLIIDLGKDVVRDDFNTFTLLPNDVTKSLTNETLPKEADFEIQCSKKTPNGYCTLKSINFINPAVTSGEAENLKELQIVTNSLTTYQNPENKIYSSGKVCKLDGSCQQSIVALSDGIAPLWGKYQYYKLLELSNNNSVTAAKQDFINELNNYNDFVTGSSGIQFQFFNCTYAYDIWQDITLDTNTREKAAELCRLSYDIEPQPTSVPTISPSQLTTILATKNAFTPLTKDYTGLELEKSSVRVSHYAIRHLLRQETELKPKFHDAESLVEEDSLQRASTWFNEGIKLYQQKQNILFPQSTCQLGTAAVEMYRATKNVNYLNFSEQLAGKINLSHECSQESSQSECNTLLYEATMCADFTQRLFDVTQKTSYKETTQTIINNLTQHYFDNENYAGKITNDGMFYHLISSSSPEQGKIIKSTKINGLLLGIMSKIGIR